MDSQAPESYNLMNDPSKSSHEKEETPVNGVSDIVGDFGRWQKIVFAFFFVCGMFSAWNSLALAFFAPEVKHWCAADNASEYRAELSNTSCLRTDGTQCDKWKYDELMYAGTIVQEWDLVCGKSWFVSLSKSSYQLGTLFAVMLAQLADKVGRFPIVFGGVILEVLAGIMSALSVNIWMYLGSRFLLAMGNAARWGSGFVIVLEIVGSKYRGDVGIGIEFGWALGYAVLPLIAYFVRDFRKLQIVLTLPEIVFIFLCWKFVPESPRWQLSSGQLQAAEKSIRHAAKMNGKEESIDHKVKQLTAKFKSDDDPGHAHPTVLDLWKHSSLRKKTALLYFTWAVTAFVYYGLSFNTNSLEGNPYINFFLSGIVEVPAYAITMYALRTSGGRRGSLVTGMVGAGLSFLLVIPLSFTNDLIWLKTAFAMFGKFFVTCTFAIIYLYSCEVYPTVVRTVGLGSSSMVARIGSIIAPFVKELGEATHPTFALTIFGMLSIVNAVVLLKFGEETDGRDIPDTIEEVERGDKELKTTDL